MTTADCEVLVVGAGPTGLIAAALLKRAGVDVRIVERRTTASRESRAFAVQARTLEVMRSMGLADRFLERGVIATGIDIHVRGKFRGGLNLDLADAPDTPYQYILMIPQSETEAILIDDLRSLGVEVERGVEVEDVVQDDQGAAVRLRQAESAGQVRALYVLGADGSRSVVRTAAGLAFDGQTLAQSFLLADCKVEWPLDHQRFRVFIHGRRIGLFLPLDGTRLSRVMATDLDGPGGDATEPAPLDVAEIETAFAQSAGIDVKLSDPVWVTRYRAHQRGVEHYRRGRLFVAGDAAHIHSPAGGQGMNTGLQDAANLAWKLAAVIRNGANEDLLDTYQSERHPVGIQVVKSTGKLFSAAAGQAGWQAFLRDMIAIPVLALIRRARPVQRKAFMGISERNIRYDLGRYVCEGPTWPKRGPRAGDRAPDARLSESGTVFDLLQGYGFTVLAFSRRPLDPDACEDVRSELDRLQSAFPGLTCHLVARVARGRDRRATFVSDVEAFDRYGVDGRCDQALYLVRPDGYVAWRAAGLDVAACRRMLSEFAPSMTAEAAHG